MPTRPRIFHTGVAMRRSILPASLTSLALIGALVGCSPTSPEPVAPEPVATPVSHPIPEGCPTAEHFTEEMGADAPYIALNFSLLSSQLKAPLPGGGCAFANSEAVTNDEGTSVSFIYILYFTLNEPNHITTDAFEAWAQSIGSTATEEYAYDLPDDYSGLTKGRAFLAGAINGSRWLFGDVLPEYAQGSQGIVRLWLPTDDVDALKTDASGGDTAYDPTTALANGLKLRYSVEFDIADEDGYSTSFDLSGSLEPFTSSVADSKPGEFQAATSGSMSGTVTNTTAARNASIPGVGVMAIYPLGSAMCTPYNGVSKAGNTSGSDYCSVGIGGVSPSELTPGQSLALTDASEPVLSGPHKEGSDALDQLNAPIAIYATFGGEHQMLMTKNEWTSQSACEAPSQYGRSMVVVMEGWPDLLCT